jgi:hypothetical protein
MARTGASDPPDAPRCRPSSAPRTRELFGFVERDRLGGGLDYAYRLTPALSAFARGWAGAERDALDRWQAGYGALAGLRWQW